MSAFTTPPEAAVGVVILRDGKVLLGQRTGSHGAGEWGLPGGKIDPGQSPQETAIMEVAEETGLQITGPRRLPHWSYDPFPQDGRHFVTLFLIADDPGGDPQLLEPNKCTGWEWFSLDALPSPTFCGFREVVGAIDLTAR